MVTTQLTIFPENGQDWPDQGEVAYGTVYNDGYMVGVLQQGPAVVIVDDTPPRKKKKPKKLEPVPSLTPRMRDMEALTAWLATTRG